MFVYKVSITENMSCMELSVNDGQTEDNTNEIELLAEFPLTNIKLVRNSLFQNFAPFSIAKERASGIFILDSILKHL